MSDRSGFNIIAVDGGAATGKSSTSRAIAERLNLMHVDTGAHYRTLTFALLDAGADPETPDAIPALLESLKIDTVIKARSALLSINGDVPADADIRSPEVNATVSKFAAIESVRKFLFNYQRSQAQVARDQAEFNGLIMEGRDIGSVIFPSADFRFFLFADETTRAARRAQDGQTDSIAERDKRDSQRKTAPLVCPEGATRVDTGPLPLEGVVDHICGIITEGKV
ncbi:MAG: cytidylate kinase [Opitutaceae bacterium BACL24 MAG-120322-bin51]|jgi:CMP/dCMP kinase|nr:MAG: cytidylate kinase [Opitutaceae bacterium BACL24 MAG-120322-bin51]